MTSPFIPSPFIYGDIPGGGQASVIVVATTAPTISQNQQQPGTFWLNPEPAGSGNLYYLAGFLSGVPQWELISTGSGSVVSVTGTANQILASPTTGAVVLSLIGPYTPATYTAHGVLIGEGTSSIVATAAGTAGQVLTSGGASADPTWTTATFPSTATAGALIAATATNVIGQIADVAVGQLLTSGGVGVIPAYTASPSVTGSITAGTTITATSGAITATNGNFVASAVGTGIVLNSAQASGVAASPVVVNGRSGRATFTTVSIAAAADLTLTLTNSAITALTTEVMLSMSGATTGSALSIKSKTASAGSLAIVVTNGTGATTTTADIQIDFLILNA